MYLATDIVFDHDNAPYAFDVITPVFWTVPLTHLHPLCSKPFIFDTEEEVTEELPTLQELKAAKRGLPTRTAHEAEFLKYHYKYGHISMLRICAMAQQGILPKHLAKCNLPICLAFIYGKQVKRAWRTNPTKDFAPHTPTEPGQLVAVCLKNFISC
jgi:hypothetical protein